MKEFKITRQKPGNIISVLPLGTPLGEGGSTASKLVAPTKDNTEWKYLGATEEVSSTPEIEEDSVVSFDRETLSWQEEKDPNVKGHTKKFTLVEYSNPVWQLIFGSSEELKADTSFRPFSSNKPYIETWAKFEKYTATGELIATEILWGRLMMDGDLAENSKLAKPKMKFLRIASPVESAEVTSVIAEEKTA